MKVYACGKGEYEYYSIYKVFDSREKAEQYKLDDEFEQKKRYYKEFLEEWSEEEYKEFFDELIPNFEEFDPREIEYVHIEEWEVE